MYMEERASDRQAKEDHDPGPEYTAGWKTEAAGKRCYGDAAIADHKLYVRTAKHLSAFGS